jgi:glycosyltransferase involved in cell wall biosynthesis
MVSSVVPDTTGSGHPMRVGMFLEALAQVAEVDVIVPAVPAGSSWKLPVSLGALMGTFPADQPQDNLISLARTLPKPELREAAFRAYGKPSGTACAPAGVLTYMRNLGQVRDYDIVHVCRLWMAEAGLAAAGLGARLTLDLDEDDFTSSDSMARLWMTRGDEHAARMREIEAAASDRMIGGVAVRFERLWISNEADAATLTARHPTLSVDVVPNAVGHPECPVRADDGNTLLFIGSFNYEPNIEGVLWFAKAVWPRLLQRVGKPLRLVIAGPNPPPSIRALARPRRLSRLFGAKGVIEVLGWVPELRPLYQAATLVVAPLRAGKGTRLKLLEAAAEGVPIVSTPAAAHGLPADALGTWLADDEDAFVEACQYALDHPAERQQRALRGHAFTASHFDRTKAATALAWEFRRLAGEG